jgi:hypothetical protein
VKESLIKSIRSRKPNLGALDEGIKWPYL